MRHIMSAVLAAISLASGAAHAASTPLERHVVATYKEYAWTLIFDIPARGTELEAEKLPKLKRIFSGDLARAIAADAACNARTGGVCALGETVLFGSQDPVAFDMTFAASAANIVDVCYKDQAGKKSCLKISGTNEGGRALIRDIQYPDGPSLRQILSLKP